MTREKKHPDDTGAALFRAAMKDVHPLGFDENRVAPEPRRPPPHPRQTERDQVEVLREMAVMPLEHVEVEAGDELIFLRPGIQHSVLRKLRRGQYSDGAKLDLHGMNIPQAHQALAGFLRHCRVRRINCVRIIHGKGFGSKQQKPVLKNRVNAWLRQRDEILAFCSARPEDGGTGALYVLLKRK